MEKVQSNPRAIILTDGILHTSDAKTAHGLIRGTERFEIVAVIDALHAGKDAGAIVDGKARNIPVYSNVQEAVANHEHIGYCIIGIATVGGVLPERFVPVIRECIQLNMSIVNGLHEYLSDRPDLQALALTHQVQLIDVRKPKPKSELHFWSGKIHTVKAPIIAVIGTDCALGKRTTCRFVKQACAKNQIRAEMIYTGQTGWMQGGKYGFIFDSTLNDFISGELEQAIVDCWEKESPQLILIEGQSALRNPSGPCGAELLVSGNAKHVILVHAPKRKHYEHTPEWGVIHSVESEIKLIEMYGAQVIALALNTESCTLSEALAFKNAYAAQLHIPVLLPIEEGVDEVIPVIQGLI